MFISVQNLNTWIVLHIACDGPISEHCKPADIQYISR